MDLKKERLIKSRLGLVLKVLLVALALFKLIEFFLDRYNKTPTMPEARPTESVAVDTLMGPGAAADGLVVKKDEPIPNSAGVYIFGPASLDRQASRHIGNMFFKEYTTTALPSNLEKEALLSGNFESAANTEWVCVGTIDYHFDQDGEKTTCEVSVNFDTYNALTGKKVKHLSKSILRYGIGFSKAQAKSVALGKVHL